MKPRHIHPRNIQIGDTIRVTHDQMDARISFVGRVAKRDHFPQGVSYYTVGGVSLLEAFASGHTIPPQASVTLIDRLDTQTPLKGLNIE